MLTVKDIPDDMLRHIRETFDRDPNVLKLRTRQDLLRREGKFREALKVAEDIDYLYTCVVRSYVDETNNQAKNISLADSGIPPRDIDKLLECVVTLFMACDVIETAIIDANSIIHRTDKEMHFEMFDDIHRVASMAKDKLRYMQENSGYGHDLVWADRCDNMYEMMRNKARSIIRKRKQQDKEEQQ